MQDCKRRCTMSNFERKFGKYAIPNLSLILILCYVLGYIIMKINPYFMFYLTLDPYQILHGQIWRIFTWIIQPPSELNVFTIIMLIFYYSLGTSLERTLGTYRYNVFLIGGILITVAASFVGLLFGYVLYGGSMSAEFAASYFGNGALYFSTYYINMSIFLAYAITFPEMQVLLMFVIPIKVKWLGILYGVMLVLDFVQIPSMFVKLAIGASLLNVAIFYVRRRNLSYLKPKEIKRRTEFKAKVNQMPKMTVHKCAVCGRTQEDDPTLEFRFCSKCSGAREYCQDHLFTHKHIM